MHGRLKVKTTEEQQEAKRKEREKKLKLYKGATNQIFDKLKNCVYDEEGLQLSGQVLAANSDFSTLWNFRKETFLHLKETREQDEMKKLFENELYFLETCLKSNPKSYGTWHHRCFIMNNMMKPDWKRELELCNKFLEYDERNFHCWDYRRFVVKKSNVSPGDELKFTTDKITSNFSNYSSWHYRSKLLPVVYPDPAQPVGVQEDILLQEYETVQNAFFTDPDDQSSWFYHRWLLGRGDQKLNICGVHASRQQKHIIVHLSKDISVTAAANFEVFINGSVQSDVVITPVNKFHSRLWILKIESFPEEKAEIELKLDSACHDKNLSVILNGNDEITRYTQSKGKQYSSESSAATIDTLTRELQSIKELLDLEPENKWAILTAVSLMRAIDGRKYKTSVNDYLDELMKLDSKRTMYYKDMKSRYHIENLLEETEISHNMDLSQMDLTALYHSDCFFAVKSMNLSNNKFTTCQGLHHLQCLRKLNLDNNNLSQIDDISKLQNLQELSLANNNIHSIDALTELRKCSDLQSLTLVGNPVCEIDADFSILLPNVECITR